MWSTILNKYIIIFSVSNKPVSITIINISEIEVTIQNNDQ